MKRGGKKTALMVAEKPSVAKSVAEFLSKGRGMSKLNSKSKYNPVFSFDYTFKSG